MEINAIEAQALDVYSHLSVVNMLSLIQEVRALKLRCERAEAAFDTLYIGVKHYLSLEFNDMRELEDQLDDLDKAFRTSHYISIGINEVKDDESDV